MNRYFTKRSIVGFSREKEAVGYLYIGKERVLF